MSRRRSAKPALTGKASAGSLYLATAGLVLTAGAIASPDGAEWATVDDPEGCRSCHLGEPATDLSGSALRIDGLPEQAEAGEQYELTINIIDAALKNGGFLLSVSADAGSAGTLQATDNRAETNGTQARSTWEGTFPDMPGEASWQLLWTAPATLPPTLIFDLWGNAGNDDLSPLGDRPHHRIWQLPQRADD